MSTNETNYTEQAEREPDSADVTLRDSIDMKNKQDELEDRMIEKALRSGGFVFPETVEEVQEFERTHPDPVELPKGLQIPYSKWLPDYTRRKIEKVRNDPRLSGFERLLIATIDAMTENTRTHDAELIEALANKIDSTFSIVGIIPTWLRAKATELRSPNEKGADKPTTKASIIEAIESLDDSLFSFVDFRPWHLQTEDHKQSKIIGLTLSIGHTRDEVTMNKIIDTKGATP